MSFAVERDDAVREKITGRAGVVRAVIEADDRIIVDLDGELVVVCQKDWARDQDGCIVETAPLAALLVEHVDNWRQTRPATSGQWSSLERGASDVEPMSPYAALAFQSGLPESRIRKLRNPKRHPVTELSIADAFVAAIDRPDVWYVETTVGRQTFPPLNDLIRENPKASPERRSSGCCGGSEHSLLGA